jgi:hypothetical protein
LLSCSVQQQSLCFDWLNSVIVYPNRKPEGVGIP